MADARRTLPWIHEKWSDNTQNDSNRATSSSKVVFHTKSYAVCCHHRAGGKEEEEEESVEHLIRCEKR